MQAQELAYPPRDLPQLIDPRLGIGHGQTVVDVSRTVGHRENDLAKRRIHRLLPLSARIPLNLYDEGAVTRFLGNEVSPTVQLVRDDLCPLLSKPRFAVCSDCSL